MRRKRRNRGTWFPVLGTRFAEGEKLVTYDILEQTTNLGEPSQGPGDRIGLDIVPLTWDFTDTQDQASGNPGVSLRDLVEGQDCVLERVVGKVYAQIQQNAAGALTTALCCAALGVFPVDDDTQASTLEADDMDPLIADNSQQPWLWRRTWLLTNYVGAPEPFYYSGEANDLHKGSALDGPHLDTKGTRRRIRKEQRIFLVLTTRAVDYTRGTGQQDSSVRWLYDVRLFGSMRKGRNISTFK